MRSKKKFKYDYAGELARRGLSYKNHAKIIWAAAGSLMQRGEWTNCSDRYEQADANRRAIIAEIDLMSPKTPPRPVLWPKTPNNRDA